MPDATYDAVIIGGGNKALLLAMYLTKYGGMRVAVFERRHELGGCLTTEETAAPGFRGNTHANIILPWYYLPVWRDFPEFWGYGAKIDQYLCSNGSVFRNNQTCLTIYSQKHDPAQERSAKEIARFSQRDAERWLKLWGLWQDEAMQRVQIDSMFNPAEFRLAPEVLERQMAIYGKLVEAGFEPDSLVLAASPLRAAREFWESQEMQYCVVRFALTAAMDVNEPATGADSFGLAATLPTISFAKGGGHQIAHAAYQILVGSGCQFFTHTEVDKVIIENGSAKGIRLSDGTEVGARKLVVSTLNPQQLCFDLIGREHLDYRSARRIELLESTFACYMNYSFALREAPRYEAAQFNPDVNECYWLGLAENNDPEHVARECLYRRLGKWPPLEDYCPVVWCHSLVDPSYAPEGKHIAHHEQLGPPATAHTEREWLELKKRYAQELIGIWWKYAPNMTWDNVIGYHANSPYDNLRMKNLEPNGTISIVDNVPYQRYQNRPIPELANHRTPIKNLYATGTAWHPGANAGAGESYNCYKIIATDLGLGKPWEEHGKEEPDSLVHQMRTINKSLQESATVKT
ncbi:MAG: NAD(P)/FAD-dependent oxidoreductase [Dehalococcoidia bacterium]|nr:NAD(P)/FAD-dependent oxidoreductase [Dehalococcoidia bacterium]